jgi:hypothetical protein
MMIISPANAMTDRWFKFDKKVDFAHCGPILEESSQKPGARSQ